MKPDHHYSQLVFDFSLHIVFRASMSRLEAGEHTLCTVHGVCRFI